MTEFLQNYVDSVSLNLRVLIFLAVSIVALWVASGLLRLIINTLCVIIRGIAGKIGGWIMIVRMISMDSAIVRTHNAEKRNMLIRKSNIYSERFEEKETKPFVFFRHKLKPIKVIKWIATFSLIIVMLCTVFDAGLGANEYIKRTYLEIEEKLLDDEPEEIKLPFTHVGGAQ